LTAGARHVAVFTAATETFTLKNIGMSINESLSEFAHIVRESKRQGIKVRGYVSTAFGCPYEGEVSPAKALRVVERLLEIGVTQVSIGDTIGVATPKNVDRMIRPALRMAGSRRIAVHFHDTRGTALANTLRALEEGVRVIDSSAGGLGGCPFAPSATGNLATEDLIYMLNGMGIRSGIDLQKLCQVSLKFSKRIKRPLTSRYLQAFASQCR
jgi:hydroxymethylglutaryl-CoA lyase